jgi:hypothetical protein
MLFEVPWRSSSDEVPIYRPCQVPKAPVLSSHYENWKRSAVKGSGKIDWKREVAAASWDEGKMWSEATKLKKDIFILVVGYESRICKHIW